MYTILFYWQSFLYPSNRIFLFMIIFCKKKIINSISIRFLSCNTEYVLLCSLEHGYKLSYCWISLSQKRNVVQNNSFGLLNRRTFFVHFYLLTPLIIRSANLYRFNDFIWTIFFYVFFFTLAITRFTAERYELICIYTLCCHIIELLHHNSLKSTSSFCAV